MSRRVATPRGEMLVCRDPAELSQEAAALFRDCAQGSVTRCGRFTAALSGGSTPQLLYQTLAGSPFRKQVPWRQTHLYWADERAVPPADPCSNFGMVDGLLLRHVPVPKENVHRMQGEQEPTQAAAQYEATLRADFGGRAGTVPSFDLILLGLGADGHIASLFPGSPALEEKDRLVAANYVANLSQYRLTLTFPVINGAALVVFLVAGRAKSAVLREILQGDAGAPLPARRVQPADGRLLWMVDEDAAGASLA